MLDRSSRENGRDKGQEKGREKGDRRQLSVLFCDVAGSSQILETINEEDWSYVLHEYHSSCQSVIERYDGHIAQYLGDGLLAYFGYPVAHENNPHRAIKAALEIVAQIDSINDRVRIAIGSGRTTLSLRVAIHTGLVVVDELGGTASAERIALGMVPTIAARLQQEAADNCVVISDSTYQLVKGAFECRSLGPLKLKGITSLQPAHQVTGESGLQSRFEVQMSQGLTPFVGRDEELARLAQLWREATDGSSRVVLIDADAGIGKSRLVQEFTERLGEAEHLTLLCRCSPYSRNSAYYPVINLIYSLLGLRAADPASLKLERIERAIQRIGMNADEGVPLIARLLSIPYQERYRELALSALQEKQKLQDLLIEWLRHEAALRPIRLFVEDLHWVDPSSRELLDRLVVAIRQCRILLLIAFRPEIDAPWLGLDHTRRLTLGPLPKHCAEAMVRSLQGDQALTPDVVQRLVAHTDGVPLFVEESTLLVLAHGSDERSPIPASLHDLLMARLDRLGQARELAQLAATIGHDFSLDMLREVSRLDETSLQEQLEQLIAAGLVRKHDEATQQYSFKHALVRDTAYHSLLTRARRAIHQSIADAFVEQFADIARSQPELVAHHYTEAGVTQKAVDYWQKAGLRSTERCELQEAIQHLRKGLELLATLPRSDARLRQELDFQAVLAGRLIATEGYGAAGVEPVYTRALEIARELGDPARSLQMMLGLESFHFMRANFQTAHRLADECMVFVRQLREPSRELIIHWVLGEIFFHQGDHTLSEVHLTECMNRYQKSHHRPRTLQDPAVMSISYYSWTRWMLGYPEQALRMVARAISLAEELAHPFSKAVAYSFAAGMHLFRGEVDSACEFADRAIDLCTEHGFPVWLAYCTVVRGRSRVLRGEASAGTEEMERGAAAWQASGAVVTIPYHHVQLAEGLAAIGRPDLGLRRVEEAQSLVDRTGERYYEAEICRVRGELLLQARDRSQAREEAAAYFMRAIDIAHRQAARSLELRAVVSLTRLQRGFESDESLRARLGAIYHWFTEGTDTADLKQARQLLSELL